MKKSFLTLMLAIVSSVWMINEASNWCMPSVRTLTEPWIEVNGTFQDEGFPCEPDEICPPCLTIVLVTSDKTYYLVTDDGQLIDQLDTIPLGTKATVSGIPFEHGSYDYIQVSHIEKDRTSQLPSLCDEWNIVLTYNYENATRYCTYTQKLTTDTIIGEQVYVKSDYEHKYIGAFREGENRDIYCVPATRNEEYLMYAWNAQVGDTLYNLLVGGGIMYALQFSDRAVVREIKETTPRTFVVDYEYIYNRKIDGADTTWWEYQWIEGVGMTCGPSGDICPFNFWVKSDVLCAYKDEEQVYQSEFAQEHGCVYDEIVCADTIPIYYASDDPGSSTVDPVDPNQVVVTLKGDELTIKDYSGETITYSVKKESGNNASRRMPMYEDTFQDSVSVELTEEGQYRLDLTNPNWDYRIYGVFSYPHSPQDISEVAVPACSVEKMLRDGELLIRKGNAIYTVTGIRVE